MLFLGLCMSIFSIKFSVKLLLISIVLMSGIVGAEGKRRSDNSYLNYKDSKAGFCGESSTSAEHLIKNLDKKNQTSLARIEAIKEEINSDIAAITILQETQRVKTEYLANIKKMTDTTTKRIAANIKISKEVFSQAMMLSSLSVVMLDKNNPDPAKSLKEKICTDDKFKYTATCVRVIALVTPMGRDERSYDNLEKALKNISKANKDTLQSLTLEIIKSIPKEFSPDIMIALLKTKLELQQVINAESTGPLIRCINNSSDQDCVKFFGDKNKSKDLFNAVLNQSSQISDYLQTHIQSIKDTIAQNEIEIEKDHLLLTGINDKSVIDLKAETEKCISGINAQLISGSEEHKNKMRGLCEISDKDQFQHVAKANIDKLSKQLELIRNDEFKTIESFKSYLANRYICMCDPENKITRETINSCYRLDGVEVSSTIYKLGGDISGVIKNIIYADKIANECSPSAQTMNELHERCQKVSEQDHFKAVCASVSNENQKQQKIAASDNAWKVDNEKYWITRDSSVKGGVRRTPKKTTMELLGEGLAPVITSLVPIWLTNLQMTNQIDMLTQQALAEKQYYHTVEMYNQNPWMYGAPYFQGHYLPTQNIGAIGVSSTTSGTNNTGYNFSIP